MNADYTIQIEQAAIGCVSGTLAEWPLLDEALRECAGISLPKETDALSLKRICRGVLAYWKAEGWMS